MELVHVWSRRWVRVLCLVMAVGFVAFVYFLSRYESRQRAQCNQIEDFALQYMPYQAYMNDAPRAPSPYRAGKLLLIDCDYRRVDSTVQDLLPDALRAVTPGEVGTVVWLQWDSQVRGRYGSVMGRAGYQHECTLTAFDVTHPASPVKVVEGVHILGPPPPNSIDASEAGDLGSPGIGTMPYDEIIRYLAALPRH